MQDCLNVKKLSRSLRCDFEFLCSDVNIIRNFLAGVYRWSEKSVLTTNNI